MMNNIKRALGLIKYSANKRTVVPVAIIYPLLCVLDFFVYKCLFMTPLCIGLLPIIILQYIYATEMAGFVITGGHRKQTIINGTFGVMAGMTLFAYAVDVVMLYIESKVVNLSASNNEFMHTIPPQMTLIMVAVILGIFQVLAPFMYRKYILTMVIFIPICGMFGGVVGFISGSLEEMKYNVDEGMEILGMLTNFWSMALVGLVVIVIGLALFYLTSHIMYKYPMDRYAFRQMFREKKSKA